MTSNAHWYPAYIGLGSNLDGPERQLYKAIGLLKSLPDTIPICHSSLYRSAPYGGLEQPDFVNSAAALMTQLSAHELLAALQVLEISQGRVRDGERWGPRLIDLDLLAFSQQRIDDERLTVPHPGIVDRNFVLLPLREIAPDLNIPGLGRVKNLAVDWHEPAISRIA